MQKVQYNRYNTALAVQHYMSENAHLYAHNAPMVATVALLNAKMDQLETQMRIQKRDSKGWTADKKTIRKELENQAFALSAGCCVYALVTENPQFYKLCYYTKSDLLHQTDNNIRLTCEDLQDFVTEHAADLLSFNISAEMIAEFDLARAKFNEIVSGPRDAIGQKADATAAIQVQVTAIMNLIRLRLDKVMVSMLPIDPHFVSMYKLLKRIQKVPHHKRSLTVVVRDADTLQPLAEAAIETANKIKRNTGEKGQSYVAHLPEGKYKLQVSHPGYDPQSLKYSVIAHNATKVQVLLQKTVIESMPEPVEDATAGFVPSTGSGIGSEMKEVVPEKRSFGFYFKPS